MLAPLEGSRGLGCWRRLESSTRRLSWPASASDWFRVIRVWLRRANAGEVFLRFSGRHREEGGRRRPFAAWLRSLWTGNCSYRSLRLLLDQGIDRPRGAAWRCLALPLCDAVPPTARQTSLHCTRHLRALNCSNWRFGSLISVSLICECGGENQPHQAGASLAGPGRALP